MSKNMIIGGTVTIDGKRMDKSTAVDYTGPVQVGQGNVVFGGVSDTIMYTDGTSLIVMHSSGVINGIRVTAGNYEKSADGILSRVE